MIFPMEGQFILGIQQLVFSTPWMKTTVIFCARWLILANVLVAIALLQSRHAKSRHAVFEAAWSVGLALLLTAVLAFFIQRVRPYLASSAVALLIPPPLNTSFPSGHTASSFALAFAFLKGDSVAGAVSLGIALFVAFGRMAVGVHYPTDVLGGIVVGYVSFVLIRLGHTALRRRFALHGKVESPLS